MDLAYACDFPHGMVTCKSLHKYGTYVHKNIEMWGNSRQGHGYEGIGVRCHVNHSLHQQAVDKLMIPYPPPHQTRTKEQLEDKAINSLSVRLY